MKKSLNFRESILVGSMLFGMFFGAGNLIFPVHMGQLAGTNVWPAIFGFILTGVGIPLLGVACLGASEKESLFDLASLVGDKYKYFLTTLLYLTIGPFFAIPRCASTSFTIGLKPLVGDDKIIIAQLIFTFIFFAIVLFFSLRPSGIMTWVGQYINPIFLIFLIILIIISFINPLGSIATVTPDEAYTSEPFFKGFLEGYGTMDAIAALAFGITIIRVVKNLGIKNKSDVAYNTVKAGAIGCVLMAIIYVLTTLIGTMSRGVYETSENGGIALSQIAHYYFGKFGIYFLLATVTLACIKTAISLVVSCSEMFHRMFPMFLSEKAWAIAFTLFSFVVSNFGLSAIITYAIPVLMFLYPLTISLIFLALLGKFFNYDKKVFAIATVFNMVAAIFDFIVAFPSNTIPQFLVDNAKMLGAKFFPFFGIGLGWLIPTIIGAIIGLIWKQVSKAKI